MKLSHFFIDHPRFAAVVNIFIMVFGLAAASFLPVAQYPNIVPPTVQITASYPGASADTVARTVDDAARTSHQWRREHGLHQQPIDG
jgi:multidrug efflux pump subunit AcrB